MDDTLPRGRTCNFDDFGGEKVRIGRGTGCNEANTPLNYKKKEIEKSEQEHALSPFRHFYSFFLIASLASQPSPVAQSQHVTLTTK